MSFLDVPGASGAQYRFRRSTTAELPPAAGNVVVIAGAAARRRFLACGAAHSLKDATTALDAVLREANGAQLYIRLNVGRTVRDAEHADIVAAVTPETDLPSLE